MEGSEYMDSLELESVLNFSSPLNCSVLPRWKRKEMEKQRQNKITNKIYTQNTSDRFIPNRESMNFEVSQYQVLKDTTNSTEKTQNDSFATSLAENLSVPGIEKKDDPLVLTFKGKAPESKPFFHTTRMIYSENKIKEQTQVLTRELPNNPERILDAPDLLDDYYLNLLDWNIGNILSIALGSTVYLWNASSGTIQELTTLSSSDNYVCSLSFVKQGGNILAIGTNNKTIQLWDIMTNQLLRTMTGHQARVSCMDWNEYILASGSRDTNILLHDVRVQQSVQVQLKNHTQEVCNLKWSGNHQYLASGSNDNLLNVWNVNQSSPVYTIRDHQAAVKALAWCPYQKNVLASGGGTADHSIKLWNVSNGCLINNIDAGSQVCSLLWNPHERELLSSHGFSQNQLSLWSYPSMNKIKDFHGHTSRVLHMAISPDGQTVCSGSADETLRFWKIFGTSSLTKYGNNVKSKNVISNVTYLR